MKILSKSKLERASEESYTIKDIRRGLGAREQLRTYAMHGDLNSIHLIVDAEHCVAQTDATARQLECMQLVWVEGYTLGEAATLLGGISASGVRYNLQLLEIKIQRVLNRWRNRELRERGLQP